MLNEIFETEKVTTFLKSLSTLNRYQNKDIPNTISEEKIDDTEEKVEEKVETKEDTSENQIEADLQEENKEKEAEEK